ncbi:MAG TPA: fasciclin domain-containing protein [Allosphingosinicella sp.]|jgi:uncharacterized surface protein with fasciclin (FAS1) repeats
MKRSLFAAALLLAACQQEDGGNGSGSQSNGAAPAAAAKAGQQKTDLLHALGASGDHRTLANALEAAGLSETLSGAQPYTLFAPTEAAFAKLPPGAANGLLAPEAKGRLVALLTGHIVPGFVTAQDLGRAIERGKGKAELATVGGSDLSFTRDGGSIVVTDGSGGRALVTGAERLASNGVVHGVDGVLNGK